MSIYLASEKASHIEEDKRAQSLGREREAPFINGQVGGERVNLYPNPPLHMCGGALCFIPSNSTAYAHLSSLRDSALLARERMGALIHRERSARRPSSVERG